MKKNKNRDLHRNGESTVKVNVGNLLENDLMQWRGGSHHVRGIAEYISNSDDSYRRSNEFIGQNIEVEIHSARGKQIDKLVIRDTAEGMSLDDLEGKFFRYFESYSGREKGLDVSGQFGTGGKAYAIMNFQNCWITSVKDEIENKAWFKWDSTLKEIVKGYSNGGYTNKKVKKQNGTTVELNQCLKNSMDLSRIVVELTLHPRIRHVVKSQKVNVSVFHKKNPVQALLLEYDPPNEKNALQIWSFNLPEELRNTDYSNQFILRYFEKPIPKENFIDISDGISTIADLEVSKIDGRPFAKYINGNITIQKLKNSTAVKENRKGLEEDDDLTIEIESFLGKCVQEVINEIQESQRKKERERNIQVSNEKIKELNKFLKKCDLNFKRELGGLIRSNRSELAGRRTSEAHGEEEIYRRPLADDNAEDLIRGTWGSSEEGDIDYEPGDGPRKNRKTSSFTPDPEGTEFAVQERRKREDQPDSNRKKSGIVVLMSDTEEISEEERPSLSQYEEPVIDKDLTTKGIIWINANNPIIVKYREKKENEALFNEAVANYVLLVVAQYQTQRVLDAQPEADREEPLILFRQKYFALQRDLREDSDIAYFVDSSDEVS